MSKSKGEFLTISLLQEKGYSPLAYRFMCLNSHYRKVLVFSYEALEQASTTYEKLKKKILTLKEEGEIIEQDFEKYTALFKEKIGDDLNTAEALTVLYAVLKDATLNDKTKRELVKSFDTVFSLDLLKEEEKEISSDLENYILEKIEERRLAKESKNYALADQIRKELEEKNVIIKDTREGTTFEIK